MAEQNGETLFETPVLLCHFYETVIIITVIYLFIYFRSNSIPNSLGFKIYRNNHFSRFMLEHIDNVCYYASVCMRGLQKKLKTLFNTSSLLDVSYLSLKACGVILNPMWACCNVLWRVTVVLFSVIS